MMISGRCASFVIASEAKQSSAAAKTELLRRHSSSKTGVNALLPRNVERANPSNFIPI
jgi:hypothetical protein